MIRSEREGNENWPEFRVEEELYALAFDEHPYRWDALGYPSDIRSLTPADLRAYYRKYYGPKNAVLVISGGFDARAVRADVRRRFSKLPAAGDDPHVTRVEPPMRSERRSTLRGPGTNPLMAIGYPAPSIGDASAEAVMLLDAVLGGDTRLFAAGTMWGRPSDHPSSRMYRALVDTGLAVRATTEWRPRVHPGLFTFYIQSAEGVPFERIESVVGREARRIAKDGPTREEMAELRTKIERGAALAYEGATRTGFRLGYFEMLGTEGLERRLYRRLLATPASAVRESAKTLFGSGHRVVVRYEPTEEGGSADA
ncbi:MAG: insulinase family protein [Thermoplasmata archaeon]|nr:insulinase family protein [Thermoplasmata archaeon]